MQMLESLKPAGSEGTARFVIGTVSRLREAQRFTLDSHDDSAEPGNEPDVSKDPGACAAINPDTTLSQLSLARELPLAPLVFIFWQPL